jgi:hypothetical protein
MQGLRRLGCLAALAMLAAGCGESRNPTEEVQSLDLSTGNSGAPQTQFGFQEAMYQPAIGSGAVAARQAASSARARTNGESDAQEGAQIAYSYAYGFRVDAKNLPGLQQRHRALCLEMGSDCRVLSLVQSGNEDYGYGEMKLQVAASRAEEFGTQLSKATDGIDAEQVSFGISGEDLTEQIIDTEARLEGRRVLRDRLMEVLRTRQGSVGDLVQAERGVAEVNEEIDAATQRLASMRNRVAFSAVNITYDPMLGEYQIGFTRPIAEAFRSVGSTLGITVAVIIYAVVALVPIIALLLGLRWIWRKSGFRLRRRRDEP